MKPVTLEEYQSAGEEFWPKYWHVAKELGETAKPEEVLKVMEVSSLVSLCVGAPKRKRTLLGSDTGLYERWYGSMKSSYQLAMTPDERWYEAVKHLKKAAELLEGKLTTRGLLLTPRTNKKVHYCVQRESYRMSRKRFYPL